MQWKHCIFIEHPPKKTTHNYNDKDDVPGKVDEKATQLHAIASLKVLLDATKPQRGGATTSAANHVKINLKETTLADRPNGNIDTTLDSVSWTLVPIWCDIYINIRYLYIYTYNLYMLFQFDLSNVLMK